MVEPEFSTFSRWPVGSTATTISCVPELGTRFNPLASSRLRLAFAFGSCSRVNSVAIGFGQRLVVRPGRDLNFPSRPIRPVGLDATGDYAVAVLTRAAARRARTCGSSGCSPPQLVSNWVPHAKVVSVAMANVRPRRSSGRRRRSSRRRSLAAVGLESLDGRGGRPSRSVRFVLLGNLRGGMRSSIHLAILLGSSTILQIMQGGLVGNDHPCSGPS